MAVIYKPQNNGQKFSSENVCDLSGYSIDVIYALVGIDIDEFESTYSVRGVYPILNIEVRTTIPPAILNRTIDFQSKTIDNSSFDLNPKFQGKNFGTKVFSNQVKSSIEEGFKKITVQAIGELGLDEFNGYIVWAKLGYTMDPPYSDMFRDLMNEMDRPETSISELLENKENEHIWKDRRFTWRGTFLLHKNSNNYTVLKNYLNKKGLTNLLE